MKRCRIALIYFHFRTVSISHHIFKSVYRRKVQKNQTIIIQKSKFISYNSLFGIIFCVFIPAIIGSAFVLYWLITVGYETCFNVLCPSGLNERSHIRVCKREESYSFNPAYSCASIEDIAAAETE